MTLRDVIGWASARARSRTLDHVITNVVFVPLLRAKGGEEEEGANGRGGEQEEEEDENRAGP